MSMAPFGGNVLSSRMGPSAAIRKAGVLYAGGRYHPECTTSPSIELRALKFGLEYAESAGYQSLILRSDSQSVIHIVNAEVFKGEV